MSYQASKKIRFFGDSWYWNWYGSGVYDYDLRSNTLKKSIFYDIHGSQKISSITFYLKELGYNAEVLNRAGSNFYETTYKILKTKPKTDIIANVIFFSSLIRTHNYKEFPIHDFDLCMEKIKNDTIKLLKKIFDWAEENQTYVFIVGGQCPLSLETFQAAGKSNYVFLMAECLPALLVSQVFKKPVEPFGLFRLACFTGHLDEKWDKKFIDVIYNDTKQYRHSPYIKLLTYPDYAHLNSLSSFAFVDMLFDKMENLQLIK